jgi:hypothetical protein
MKLGSEDPAAMYRIPRMMARTPITARAMIRGFLPLADAPSVALAVLTVFLLERPQIAHCGPSVTRHR